MRVERSELSVPGANRRMIEKAVASEADVVMLDLEDSVSPDGKVAARDTVVKALRELDWGDKPPAYRVNAVDTPFFYKDVIDVVERAGDCIALMVVPKVRRSEDLVLIDTLLTGVELHVGLPVGEIHLEAQIEDPEGLVNVERIALASPRLEALNFGPGDFAASMSMPARSIGSRDRWDDQYPGHRFGYPMARIAVAARAAGIRAIDGPVADFRDLDAYRASALVARSLGYDGKWCIHPSQIPIANEVFSPTEEEIAWARRVMAAYKEATGAGNGAISLDNTMIDVASIRLAEATLAMLTPREE